MQTILNIRDGSYGLRCLKIVKSQIGPHYVIDVMFSRGLRLTVDIIPGEKTDKIQQELDNKLRMYRSSQYDDISPSIIFLSECMSRALSDENGFIAVRQLHSDTLREAWDLTLFRDLLKTIDPLRAVTYEKAVNIVESEFTKTA